MTAQDGRLAGLGGADLELLGLRLVLAVEPEQDDVEQRAEDDDEPGALGELEHGEDEDDDRGEHGGKAVDHLAVLPARLAQRAVVLHHAGPRDREPGEHTDRVERDEAREIGAGADDEGDAHDGKDDDAVGERQPVAAPGHPAGQERIPGDKAREVGEAVEARVAPGEKDQHRRDDDEVLEGEPDAVRPERPRRHLREDRRRARRVRRGV